MDSWWAESCFGPRLRMLNEVGQFQNKENVEDPYICNRLARYSCAATDNRVVWDENQLICGIDSCGSVRVRRKHFRGVDFAVKHSTKGKEGSKRWAASEYSPIAMQY